MNSYIQQYVSTLFDKNLGKVLLTVKFSAYKVNFLLYIYPPTAGLMFFFEGNEKEKRIYPQVVIN